ncbi:Rieske (2Fe-2S) protein [Kroppenstedtia pulmonis]|uniref:Rieske (2Fe-2S) protein n=2 Tax=Kroppenstedtia pulmonis TaxID=1380685 RepID=A0A7D4BEP9_9BACL|nr:Rieske (2Fe-2S) protein [Kroppenstedtia pulmonis]QKG83752.1 Rieske (2Fe-2S) protein [Kroppenstedtia pulmonis]
MKNMIHAGTVDEIKESGSKVIKGERSSIAVFYHEGEFYALDNRCPHMGFPLHMGSLCDGILTCHWHHARFDVCSGGTLDPWADDVTSYPVEVQEGAVYVRSQPVKKDALHHYRKRLQEGLEQNLRLVIAKAVVGLLEEGEPAARVAQIGVEFGTTHRQPGWRSGLTILTAMVNILPKLDRQGKILALYQGLVHVARESAGQGTRFMLDSLPVKNVDHGQLTRWYRQSVEVRDIQGAERILLTAIRSGATEKQLADMMMAAVTDHYYMNEGHILDFHNKAFEILQHIGVEHRERVLTSLLPDLRHAQRSEELHSWQSPVDLVTPLEQAFTQLKAWSPGKDEGEVDEETLYKLLLGDQPQKTVEGMVDALHRGTSPVWLARLVTLAAAERIARFHMQNEFADWITVLHTFTHAHAVHQSLKRSVTPELLRGVFHTAMRIYLDRFLNVPAAKKPQRKRNLAGKAPNPETLLDLLDQQQQVEKAADWVSDYLNCDGNPQELFNILGHALLREDAEFHSFQMTEAAMAEHDEWERVESEFAEDAKRTLILALTRYLAAHAPTARELPHTARIAWRLHKGDNLFQED